MLTFLTLAVFLCCITGIFSRTPDVLIHRAFSQSFRDALSKIQRLINWLFCVAFIITTVTDCFIDMNLLFLGGALFYSMITVNFIYLIIIAFIAYRILKKAAIECMSEFLKNYKNKEFPNDREIAHRFCCEYMDFNEKEAKSALKYIRKNTTSHCFAKSFSPDVEVVFEFNGTKKKPCLNGYRPIHMIQEGSFTSGVHFYDEPGSVEPNGIAKGTISFVNPGAYPKSLWVGKRITIQEGPNIVGYATIVKILNPILDKGVS